MTRAVKLTLAALLLVCAAAVIWLLLRPGRTDHPVARVTLDGQVLQEIDLTQVGQPYTFVVTGSGGLTNTILVEPGRIRVEQADCPDQICVRQGYISDGSQPIVCLPNRLIIQIEGGEDALDAAAG